MKDVYFDEVAFKATPLGHCRMVSTVSEAAEELFNHWPLQEGERLSAAKRSCASGFAGTLSGACVRIAFINACKEADVAIVALRRTRCGTRRSAHD
jgi:hypothetical protein